MPNELISAVEKVFNLVIFDLKKYGRVIPTVFFYTSENNYYVPDIDFRDRQKTREFLRRTAKEIKATKFILMYSAFIGDLKYGVKPSEAPDRRRAAFIYGEDKNSNCGILQEYEIDEKKSVILGKKEILKDGIIGILTGIIKR